MKLRTYDILAGLLAATLLAFVAGCGGESSPEDAVRAVVDALESAVEARDVGDLMEHVSPGYRDAYGSGRQEASRYARGYFIAHQSIHLLTRVESIEFPSLEEARAKVLVGMAGRDADAASAWELAAELYDFDVTLVREDGDWKVTYAQWQRR